MNALIEYFLQRGIFVNLLTFFLLLVGGIIGFTMNREAFPNINFDIVSVSTVYPGASPNEVEKLVTNPIEDKLKEVDGIKEYRSSSVENLSGVFITIDPDVSDTQKVVDDIRSAIDRVEDLPDDAEQPLVQEITSSRTPVIEVSVQSIEDEEGNPVLSDIELRDQAEILEDMLLEIDGVARISRKGWYAREVHVDLIPQRLEGKYIGVMQIINALQQRNLNFPGGEIEEDGKAKVVRTVGELQTAQEVAGVYVRSNDIGQAVRIRDLGSVKDGLEEPDYIDKTNGNIAISLTVLKRESADIISLVDEVQRVTEKYKKNKPEGVEITYVNDISYFVKRRLGVLRNNAMTGLVLVVGSLFLFMGWRTSLMVAIGIPISITTAFIFMNFMGVTLNLISMFGMIIVIGILVDDAIIVSENFYRYLEEGYPPYEAAVKGTSEVVAPVIATIVTSVAAFGPMLFMTGIFGKFVFSIPLVIIITLLASLFECLFILPSHLYEVNKISRPKGESSGDESGWFVKLRDNYYLPSLRWALANKGKAMGILTGVFIVAIAMQVFLGSFKLFPGAIETFHIKITAETGTTLENTQRYIRAIEKEVAKLPPEELEAYTSRTGIIRANPNDPFTKRGSHYGQLMVYLTPENSRERTAQEVIDQIRDKTIWLLNEETRAVIETRRAEQSEDEERQRYDFTIPQQYSDLEGKLVSMDMEKMQGGPPVGKPIAVEITGKDFETLEELAEKYKKVLATVDGVVDIEDTFEPGKEEIRLKVRENLASQAGVSVQSIAMAVNTAFQGTVATTLKLPDEEVDVRVRYADEYRKDAATLNQIQVMNQTGKLIPLDRLTYFANERGVIAINHLDGKRLITVTANVDEDVTNSTEAGRAFMEKAAGIIEKYPGYRMHLGGENEDTQESFQSLGKAFGVGILIIFMILASLFRSILQPFVIMLAVPFALIGVIFAFLLHGHPFSFLAMLGVIGLSGVVVNDSIVLVDFANSIRRETPDLDLDAVAEEAGLLRLRAVMLTTATTVLGLLPTAYGIGGEDPFIVPMALSFAWGLLFSTLITLLIVPVLYVAITRFTNTIRSRLGMKDMNATDE